LSQRAGIGGIFKLHRQAGFTFNDHDPVRLHEQFSAQWPLAFSWEHLAKGPDEFRVKITKLKALAEPADAELSCSCGH
jgi:uncharacterized protein (DUF2249 family)